MESLYLNHIEFMSKCKYKMRKGRSSWGYYQLRTAFLVCDLTRIFWVSGRNKFPKAQMQMRLTQPRRTRRGYPTHSRASSAP